MEATTTDPIISNHQFEDVHDSLIPIIREKLEKINRKAAKLGIEAPSFRIVESYKDTRTNHFGDEYQVLLHTIEITGPIIKVNGWNFVASIEHTNHGNAIKRVPSFEGDIPVHFRSVGTKCDHCESSRIRKDTFLVSDNDGNFKQVGRNCLADFLGHDPARVMWYLRLVREAMGFIEECCGNFRYEHVIDHLTAITAALYFSYTKGWVSKAKAQMSTTDNSTSSWVWWLFGPPVGNGKLMEERRAISSDISDEIKEEAKKVLEWAMEEFVGKDQNSRSDYEQNLAIALQKNNVTFKDVGIVSSVVPCYFRYIDRKVKTEEDSKKTNEYFGEPGKRFELVLKVTRYSTSEGQYGCTHIYGFEDADGRNFVWFGSKILRDDANHNKRIEVGFSFSSRWTVKKHDEYKGRKQTILTRPTNTSFISG